MSRQTFLVFIEDEHVYVTDRHHVGKYKVPAEKLNETFGVFLDESEAHAYAQYLSSSYPGHDVTIFKQDRCYYSKPGNPIAKKWENGKLIPA